MFDDNACVKCVVDEKNVRSIVASEEKVKKEKKAKIKPPDKMKECNVCKHPCFVNDKN